MRRFTGHHSRYYGARPTPTLTTFAPAFSRSCASADTTFPAASGKPKSSAETALIVQGLDLVSVRGVDDRKHVDAGFGERSA